MPPRGVQPGTKRARQYHHIKESEVEAGRSVKRAEEIAARTLNKERARSGESREASGTSTHVSSTGRRAGLRAGTSRSTGATYAELYAEAKLRGIKGRSTMTKASLHRALGAASSKRREPHDR
jgi:hypothetical protein